MKRLFNKLDRSIKEKMKLCKMVVFDFDGVMTDNGVYLDADGWEMVKCDRRDGLGLEFMRKYTDVGTLVLSREMNPVVRARANKLKMNVMHGVEDKLLVLKKELKELGLDKGHVCYVGNDINDIECMEYVGLSVSVADGYARVKKAADYVTSHDGGHGAVREVCDLIMYAKGKHPWPG